MNLANFLFLCESWGLQHFRKKGPMSQWIWVGLFPITFFYLEWIFQCTPDEDYFRRQMPPPLDFPDEDDTDDTEFYNDTKTNAFKKHIEMGIINDVWYDVVPDENGKPEKVYRRFAGVNKPMHDW